MLDTYSRGLRFVRLFRLLNSEMPMQQADLLLTIARKPGIGSAELMQQTQLAQSSVSRSMKTLSKFGDEGAPGLDLVDAQIDPRATKKRIYFLTPKGKQFVNRVLKVIEEDFSIDAETEAKSVFELVHEEMIKGQETPKRNVPLTKIIP